VTTVQQIHDSVCFAMLEDGSFTSGTFSEAQFLSTFSTVILDFCQKTGMVKKIFTEMISAGVSQYQVPDDLMEPQLCFVGGRLIEKTGRADLDSNIFQWPKQWGQPKYWHEDNLEVKFVELVPKPDWNGTNIAGTGPPYGKYDDFYPTEKNLTIVGSAAPVKTTWVLGDTIEIVPDIFVGYLVYGILAQIFSADSETKDPSRASYALMRFNEGIQLAEFLLDEEDEEK
jgi:hypothetical protein